MNRFVVVVLSLAVISGLFSGSAKSQYVEDALRLSMPGLGVSARSLGLGMAYTGVANDFSATYWNPAGLGQMRLNEVTLGLSHISNSDQSNFFNNQQSFTNSSTSINSVGMVYPFPTSRGSLVFSIGYGRQADFTSGLSFKGFNPNSSIIQSWAPDGMSLDGTPGGNIAYELYLADVDSLGPNDFRWNSQITDSLTQSGKVLEGGSQSDVSVALASEVAKNFYIGATLNFITGSYSYTRNYYEDDLNNVYIGFQNWEFKSLTLLETVESDLSGFTAKLGLLYKFAPDSRIGFTVKTPSWVTIRETFSQSGTSEYYVADQFHPKNAIFVAKDNVKNEYDVTTPFVFSAGLSHSIQDLMIAADVEYTDYTQMEFHNADQPLLRLNTNIKETFQPTVNLKTGAEYAVGNIGLRLRGGFAYLQSPYSGDPSSFAQKYITAGLGFIVENSVAIDIGYAHGFRDSYRINYNDFDASGQPTSKTTEKIRTNNLITTVSYRF